MKTTWTAANLGMLVCGMEESRPDAYAAVAEKTSVRFAVEKQTKAEANMNVKIAIRASRALVDLLLYKIAIDAMGRREAIIVVIIAVYRSCVRSLRKTVSLSFRRCWYSHGVHFSMTSAENGSLSGRGLSATRSWAGSASPPRHLDPHTCLSAPFRPIGLLASMALFMRRVWISSKSYLGGTSRELS